MLAQLDQMQVSTPAPSLSVLSLASSYAIGPIDPAQLLTLHAHLSTGEECSLLVPVSLPSSILTHSMFKEGYECSYMESGTEEEWTFPKLVNEVYHILVELCYEDEPDFCPWTLGFLLGELASLAERDRTLALTGLAHSCALLSFFPLDDALPWPLYRLLHAYRARIRAWREQGMRF